MLLKVPSSLPFNSEFSISAERLENYPGGAIQIRIGVIEYTHKLSEKHFITCYLSVEDIMALHKTITAIL